MVPTLTDPPAIEVQEAILRLLRGEAPDRDAPGETIDSALRRYECGGYLHEVWRRSRLVSQLPPGWAAGITRAHRKTMLDNLVALADFRAFARILQSEGIPFIVLKGGAYLFDLYDDPGERALTDIDLLIRPSDVSRLSRSLVEAGYLRVKGDDEYRRFEVTAAGDGRCRFEVHWWLGLSERAIDQDGVWARSGAAELEGIRHLRLARDDAVLYHVSHQADHFFGPSLKWMIDLRLMLRRWPLDVEFLIGKATTWRVRVPLSLAVLYVEKLFPGEARGCLKEALAPSALRRLLLSPILDSGPLGFMKVADGRLTRYIARCLLLDRPVDLLSGVARVLRRPLLRGPHQTRRAAPRVAGPIDPPDQGVLG
jgi:hypothetical protein